MRLLSIGIMFVSLVMLAMASAQRLSNADLKQQVVATERAFAATMKARDHAAFTGFLAEEAIFLSGATALRRLARFAAERYRRPWNKRVAV